MSWRIVFLADGQRHDSGDYDWADEVITENTSAEEIAAMAKQWAWALPMKLFVGSEDRENARLKVLEALWGGPDSTLLFDQYTILDL